MSLLASSVDPDQTAPDSMETVHIFFSWKNNEYIVCSNFE